MWVLCFIIPTSCHRFRAQWYQCGATRSQPLTGRCPINFSYRENLLRRVSTLGTVGSSLPRLNCYLFYFSQTRKPSTWVWFFSCTGFLHVSANCWSCTLKCITVHSFSLTNVIDIRGRNLLKGLVLCEHGIHNRLHDKQCHIEQKKKKTAEANLCSLIFTVWKVCHYTPANNPNTMQ